MSVLGVVSKIFEPLSELVSEFITDKDALNKINGTLAQAQVQLQSRFVDLEMKTLDAKSKVIVAEAQSDSWLTSNWRPVTMVTFLTLVVAKWFGLTDAGIPVEMELELMSLIKIGLGGYVVSRGAEKVIPKIAQIVKDK